MKVIAVVFELLLIVGGGLALSPIIVAKKPNAQGIVDKLIPFQALIGVAMMVMSVIFFIKIGPGAAFKAIKSHPVPAMANLGGIVFGFVLGSLYGMVALAKAGSPNNQQRAMEVTNKIAPYQMLIGFLVVGAGALGLAYTLGLVKLAEDTGVVSF